MRLTILGLLFLFLTTKAPAQTGFLRSCSGTVSLTGSATPTSLTRNLLMTMNNSTHEIEIRPVAPALKAESQWNLNFTVPDDLPSYLTSQKVFVTTGCLQSDSLRQLVTVSFMPLPGDADTDGSIRLSVCATILSSAPEVLNMAKGIRELEISNGYVNNL